tara:strand:+ start:302 stop:517 length:216 start_codon:yes stop_codon:yes gene_type:complete
MAMAYGKIIVIIIFIGILASLGSALYSLVKDKGTEQTFKALRMRIGLSVGLFILLFVLAALGVIEPHGGLI